MHGLPMLSLGRDLGGLVATKQAGDVLRREEGLDGVHGGHVDLRLRREEGQGISLVPVIGLVLVLHRKLVEPTFEPCSIVTKTHLSQSDATAHLIMSIPIHT